MRYAVLLCLLMLSACDHLPQEPQTSASPKLAFGQAKTYRIASWNVRNLFDDVDDPYADETPSSKEYKEKLGELAQVIDQVDADFIGLQEVENLKALKELNASLSRPYTEIGLIEGNDKHRGIDVAFLSRLPIARVKSHSDHRLPPHPDTPKRYYFSRDCLEVRLQTEPPCTILLNHLKSSRGDSKRSAAKRRVQALGIVEIAEEVDKENPGLIVLMGDLNDQADSWSLEPVFDHFYDSFQKMPKELRVTHRYRKGGGALDHILLDKDESHRINNPTIWKEIARHTSDHNPVSIDLSLRASSDTER